MEVPLFVADLRKHLKSKGMSPEAFAKEVQLSHMTIRRWLRKGARESIPEKYFPILGPALGRAPGVDIPGFTLAGALENLTVEGLMRRIRKSGEDFEDVAGLQRRVLEKLGSERLDPIFSDYCHDLLVVARDSKAHFDARALAIGALLYFTDPQGLIPDHIPVIGYLDDLAILSVALNDVARISARKRSVKQ